jgi:RNA polymerase sigma-70 factor (ECF subfamily)
VTQEIVNSIINRVLSGEINAYEELIEMFEEHVFKIISKRIPTQDIDLLAHDVFVKAYQSLDRFKGKSPFENWLARITVFSCYDYWKAKEKDGLVTAPVLEANHTEWLELVATGKANERFIKEQYQQDIEELVAYALKQMSVDDRIVLEMYYIEQWSMREIGKSLNWSLPKVKIRTMRARKKMRSIIKEFLKEEV